MFLDTSALGLPRLLLLLALSDSTNYEAFHKVKRAFFLASLSRNNYLRRNLVVMFVQLTPEFSLSFLLEGIKRFPPKISLGVTDRVKKEEFSSRVQNWNAEESRSIKRWDPQSLMLSLKHMRFICFQLAISATKAYKRLSLIHHPAIWLRLEPVDPMMKRPNHVLTRLGGKCSSPWMGFLKFRWI